MAFSVNVSLGTAWDCILTLCFVHAEHRRGPLLHIKSGYQLCESTNEREDTQTYSSSFPLQVGIGCGIPERTQHRNQLGLCDGTCA
jgi:hypothetical protein